jgi:hypothetical protein
LFSGARRRVLASGLLFEWAHVVVNNLVAVALASVAAQTKRERHKPRPTTSSVAT